MTNLINENKRVETNPFANPEKSSNGGGYSQPLITGTIDGVPFELHDTSCGEFGDRCDLQLGEFFAQYDFMGNDYEYSSIPTKYLHLVEGINEAYNTSFVTIQEEGDIKMDWKQKFENEANYMLEGCTANYSQSIDRDQAIHKGKAAYDSYIFTDLETGEKETVTAEQMEDWAKTW